MSRTIVIVGCGVFGLSTAVELAKNRSFDNIIAIDAEPVPSSMSAANDINKIVRPEYADLKYMKLALEAMEKWRNDPELSSVYFECGRLSTISKDPYRARFDEVAQRNLRKLLGDSALINLSSSEEIRKKYPLLFSNSPLRSDMQAVVNEHAGYANSAASLKLLELKARELGVEFVFGKAGKFKKFVVNHSETDIDKNDNHVSVQTEDGTIYHADTILLAVGAYLNAYLNTSHRVCAKGLPVAHIQLTDEEFKIYKNMPIIFDPDCAYAFPPNPVTKLIKLASTGYEYVCNVETDYDENSKVVSIPHSGPSKSSLPKYAIIQMRRFLDTFLPDLADRSLINTKMCWISDTEDANFLIDKVPQFDNVFVANGDSGHAFKFLPNIGRYIAQRILGDLSEEWKDAWRWREDDKASELKWRCVRSLIDYKDAEFTYDK
ncbi:L-saccharopine oxidase [Schizosaccharomyces pombe]